MSVLPYFFDFEEPSRFMQQDFFRPAFFRPPFNWMQREFFAPRVFKPWNNALSWDHITTPMEQISKQMNHLAVTDRSIAADDKDKFQVSVDVQHFSPEEISVKVVDGHVIVEGNHEEKLDQHGYISRRFVRKYALPKECLPDTVQSTLSSDGVLIVTAPKVLPLPSIGERIIPITHTGPVQRQPSSTEQFTKVGDPADTVEKVK